MPEHIVEVVESATQKTRKCARALKLIFDESAGRSGKFIFDVEVRLLPLHNFQAGMRQALKLNQVLQQLERLLDQRVVVGAQLSQHIVRQLQLTVTRH